jgi:hypothetical protein
MTLTAVEPAYRCEPDYWRTLGDEVADLCGMADYEPDPEQRLGLDLIFAFDRHGKSSAFESCVICCRQNLKTGLFKQAALGWLFLTDQRLVVWSAHEFNTAQEAHRDMAALIENTPFLSRRLKRVYNGAADKSIELMTGQRLIFKARTATGGRGLSGDKVVLDEAFALRPSHMGALLPTLSVRPDPQVVYGSSAGLVESDVLRGIRDRGRAGSSSRLAYLEWAAPVGGCAKERCDHTVGTRDCALDRVENWYAANPLLGRTRTNGTGLTLDYVAAERQAMPPLEFARERLGWWDEPGAAAVFGPGKWEGCADLDDEPTGLSMGSLAIAVSWDLSHAAIVASARTDDNRFWVKPLHHAPGTDWAIERLAELFQEHQVSVQIDGRGPAARLIPHLEREGVRLDICQTTEVLDAWDSFYTAVRDQTLLHYNYPELNAAVNGATTRTVGDRTAWARRLATSDISPLEAATLAVYPVTLNDGTVNLW